MPDNPYTRQATVEIIELVPVAGMLPRCKGWKKDLGQCNFNARYLQNGEPACGVHLGKPNTVFMPESLASK